MRGDDGVQRIFCAFKRPGTKKCVRHAVTSLDQFYDLNFLFQEGIHHLTERNSFFAPRVPADKPGRQRSNRSANEVQHWAERTCRVRLC